MTVEISVITCSYNPRPDYLQQVVDALREQTLDKSRWEYLLIDNASTNPIEAGIDLSWHSTVDISEKRSWDSLTHGFVVSVKLRGDILVFVDDDNVLDADYLEQVVRVADERPRLGAWGGQTRPSFESKPPDWTKPYLSRLVIHEFESDRWSNQPSLEDTMPCGAGMCVRKAVADYYADLHASGHRSNHDGSGWQFSRFRGRYRPGYLCV